VALGGLYLTDNLAINSHTKSPIWPLSFIGTELYGYEKFIADGNPANGHEHVAFALSKGGESLGLFVTTNVPIDALTFGAQALGVSEGRLPTAPRPASAHDHADAGRCQLPAADQRRRQRGAEPQRSAVGGRH